MTKFSRSAALVVALFMTVSGSIALCQEAEKTDPAVAEHPEQAEAAAEAPRYTRPRRGAAPTLDRISGVTVDVNPDGTMTRRTEMLGGPVPGLENSPPEPASVPELPPDPSYTPPTRATVSSSNDESSAAGSTAAMTSPTETETRKDYSLLAGAGVCVLIAVVFWLTLRQPRKSD